MFDKVSMFDKELGDDLTCTATATAASRAVASSQAYWVALQCSTLSRAREIPAHPGAPRPLRNDSELWGIPRSMQNPAFSKAEKEQLEESNALIRTTFELAEVGGIANSLGNIEQPGRTLLC